MTMPCRPCLSFTSFIYVYIEDESIQRLMYQQGIFLITRLSCGIRGKFVPCIILKNFFSFCRQDSSVRRLFCLFLIL